MRGTDAKRSKGAKRRYRAILDNEERRDTKQQSTKQIDATLDRRSRGKPERTQDGAEARSAGTGPLWRMRSEGIQSNGRMQNGADTRRSGGANRRHGGNLENTERMKRSGHERERRREAPPQGHFVKAKLRETERQSSERRKATVVQEVRRRRLETGAGRETSAPPARRHLERSVIEQQSS